MTPASASGISANPMVNRAQLLNRSAVKPKSRVAMKIGAVATAKARPSLAAASTMIATAAISAPSSFNSTETSEISYQAASASARSP